MPSADVDALLMEAISFEPGTARLTQQGLSGVRKVAEMLDEHACMSIKLEGHTDCRCQGQCQAAQVSVDRASAIKEALLNAGCKHLIEVEGLGCSSSPAPGIASLNIEPPPQQSRPTGPYSRY